MTKQIIYTFSNTVLVDREHLNKLDSAELAATLQEVYSNTGKKIVFIDSALKFFGFNALETAIKTTDENLPILLEHHEIRLTSEDLATIKRANELQDYMLEAFNAKREASRPAYPFANAPKDWKLEDRIVFTSQLIKRAAAYDAGYTLGLKTARSIWDRAATVWSGNTNRVDSLTVRVAGYNKSCYFYATYIDIGCQRIERHELEAVALHLGWEFPAAKLPE